MKKYCSVRSFLFLLVGFFILFMAYNLFAPNLDKLEEIPLSKVVEQVKNNQVEKIIVDNQNLEIELKNGDKFQSYKEEQASLTEILSNEGIKIKDVNIEVKDSQTSGIWIAILSGVLPVLLIGGFIFFMMRSAQAGNSKAMSFGQSKAKLLNINKRKTTFLDVAGLKEAKQELMEVVEFLKYPSKFRRLGAEIPKGVLLVGLPGTGKTLLARAVAGEANVPFFSISASEFVEMFVGVGASRVRDLFSKAKRNAPAIIFIDELDAIGRLRGAGLGGSHDEREQTLNQILVEMDGFDVNTNIIIISATNRPDVLDPALLRPGRFDRRVVIDLPNQIEREAILKVHVKDKPLASNADLSKIAKSTAGFSGADLKNLTNEAAILAARNNKKTISIDELTSSIEKVLLGPERRSRVLTKKEREITAHHEAGHALLTHILPDCDPVYKVSIISRGAALGYTWNIPTEDRHLYSQSKFEDEITSLLGGRVAEKIIFGEVTTGAENDLKKATKMARKMATDFGMTEKLGAATYGTKDEMTFLGRELAEHKSYSEKTISIIDGEVAKIINKAEKKALRVLTKHKKNLAKMAKKLIEKETLDESELKKILPEFKAKNKFSQSIKTKNKK